MPLMRHLLLIPVVLSALTLGAHLLRGGQLLLALAAAALPLLLVPRHAAACACCRGCCSWALSSGCGRSLVIVDQRRAFGQPWHRLVLILGSVALVTALSALAAGRWQRGRGPRRTARVPRVPVEAT